MDAIGKIQDVQFCSVNMVKIYKLWKMLRTGKKGKNATLNEKHLKRLFNIDSNSCKKVNTL